MPRFSELDEWFVCPFRHSCPYLEGLSPAWVWEQRQAQTLDNCHYEHVIGQLHLELDAAHRANRQLEQENQQLRAQLQALHCRQFKGRQAPCLLPPAAGGLTGKKKRGAPLGHPPWRRAQPKHIDRTVEVPAPTQCPHCHCPELRALGALRHHLQEDIVLQPRTVTVDYVHHQAHCPHCDQDVVWAGPGELPGAYIGPAAKAVAIFLRYDLNASDRKISRFFADFFGLKFVPASAYGFERQAVRRGQPLYADLLAKVRCLDVVHADETSWRHDGNPYWVWYAGNGDLALFHLDAHRSAEAAQSLLGQKLPGTLVADAYASYNATHPKHRQSCLAHLKTKAKELDQELALLKGRAADPQARQFCQAIQGWVHHACQAHRRLSLGPWRAQAAKEQGRALRTQLQELCAQPLRHERTEKFRQRLSGKEQKLFFTCFHYSKVPPTNNQAEQSLRSVVIMRRVIHGTRSAKGLENHSVLRSLFETARRQGRKAHEFFIDLFTKDTVAAQAALYRHPLPPSNPPLRKAKAKKPP